MDYTPTGNPVDGALGDAAEIQAEFALIQAAIASKANSDSPTLTTPNLGVATATSINKITLTTPATSATLTIANGKTLTANKTLTLDGTDGTTITFPSTSASMARTDSAQSFAGTQTFSGLITAALGLNVSGAAFTSRGITDNATATALTLSGSGANSVTIANSASSPTIGTSASALNINPANHIVNVGAGAANFLVFFGHASGAPGIQPGSAASDMSLSIFSKGTGSVNIGSAAGTSEYLTIFSSTGYAGISAGGASSDVQLSFAAKGTSGIAMLTASSLTQVFVAHTASAVRYLTLTGAAAGGNPTISTSAGDLLLSSAGGSVCFGTYSAKGAEAFAGYITIKDAAGNSRKVMVCA